MKGKNMTNVTVSFTELTPDQARGLSEAYMAMLNPVPAPVQVVDEQAEVEAPKRKAAKKRGRPAAKKVEEPVDNVDEFEDDDLGEEVEDETEMSLDDFKRELSSTGLDPKKLVTWIKKTYSVKELSTLDPVLYEEVLARVKKLKPKK